MQRKRVMKDFRLIEDVGINGQYLIDSLIKIQVLNCEITDKTKISLKCALFRNFLV